MSTMPRLWKVESVAKHGRVFDDKEIRQQDLLTSHLAQGMYGFDMLSRSKFF
jgi:hypothetical protein